MSVTHIATAIAVFVMGLLPSSCTKSSSAHKSAPAANPAATTVAGLAITNKATNLGEISLTNHYETRIQISSGKSCVITPLLIDRKNLQLTMAIETRNADGKIEGLSVTQIITKPGEAFEVAAGDVDFTFTPILAE